MEENELKRKKFRFRLSAFQIILLGFAGVIFFGAFLLCMPFSSKNNTFTPFLDSLFTATSAVCVTGLVVYDTATHWSIIGQIIILLLIQIGGLGVVTVASSFALLTGKKIGLFGRGTMKEALSAPNVGGIVRLTRFILKGVFTIELLGMLVMLPVFCNEYGANGIWMSLFHSISAFCNAGFDILGTKNGNFSSLTAYSSNVLINLTIMTLIIVGGIGFLVWDDVCKHKFRFKKYRTQSKVVLIVTAVLILLPAIYYFCFELTSLPVGERILAALFQSTTTRTAGFNTVDFATFSQAGIALTIFLMLVGGSPGSTAGGMKTTTIAVLFAAVISIFKKHEDTEVLNRRIESENVKQAVVILFMYISLFMTGGAIISQVEDLPLLTCLFESASAIGTVGLTLGITPTLGVVSKLILIVFMFFGRVGGLTLIYATLAGKRIQISKKPIDKITVG